jgi:hypothetical protein
MVKIIHKLSIGLIGIFNFSPTKNSIILDYNYFIEFNYFIKNGD